MNGKKVNLRDAFGRFTEHWSPKLVGSVNGCDVKIAKLHGEFIWHHHQGADEMFLVVRGRLVIRLRDGDVELNEGEFFVVPRETEHLPVAHDEAWVMMVEPQGTLNTGNVRNARTVEQLETL